MCVILTPVLISLSLWQAPTKALTNVFCYGLYLYICTILLALCSPPPSVPVWISQSLKQSLSPMFHPMKIHVTRCQINTQLSLVFLFDKKLSFYLGSAYSPRPVKKKLINYPSVLQWPSLGPFHCPPLSISPYHMYRVSDKHCQPLCTSILSFQRIFHVL